MNDTYLILYHKYVEQQCYHLFSQRTLAFCFIPGNAFSSIFMCLVWKMLVLISITDQIYDHFHSRNGPHNSAKITVDVPIWDTSISLWGNAYRFLLLMFYCTVWQWPPSELCILLGNLLGGTVTPIGTLTWEETSYIMVCFLWIM